MGPGSGRSTHPTSPFPLAALLQGERLSDALGYLGAAGLARGGDGDPVGGLGHRRVGPRAGRDRDSDSEGAGALVGSGCAGERAGGRGGRVPSDAEPHRVQRSDGAVPDPIHSYTLGHRVTRLPGNRAGFSNMRSL